MIRYTKEELKFKLGHLSVGVNAVSWFQMFQLMNNDKLLISFSWDRICLAYRRSTKDSVPFSKLSRGVVSSRGILVILTDVESCRDRI